MGYVDIHFAVVSGLLNLAILPALTSDQKPSRTMCFSYAVLLGSLAVPSLVAAMHFNAAMVLLGCALWLILGFQNRLVVRKDS